MIKTAIHALPLQDFCAVLPEPLCDSAWTVQLYDERSAAWMRAGCLTMAIGAAPGVHA